MVVSVHQRSPWRWPICAQESVILEESAGGSISPNIKETQRAKSHFFLLSWRTWLACLAHQQELEPPRQLWNMKCEKIHSCFWFRRSKYEKIRSCF